MLKQESWEKILMVGETGSKINQADSMASMCSQDLKEALTDNSNST